MEKLNCGDNSIVFLTCFKLVEGILIIALFALKVNLDLRSRLPSKLSTITRFKNRTVFEDFNFWV